MKVAVAYENGEVFQHFGRTPQFKIYETNGGKTVSSEVVDTNGTGHGSLPERRETQMKLLMLSLQGLFRKTGR